MPHCCRRIRAAGFVVLALALGVACNDSTQPPSQRPLVFLSLIHPGAVLAHQPATIAAGVYVGSSWCWEIQAAWSERNGNVIELHGMARGVAGRVCAQALRYDSLEIVVPGLDAGTYVLKADSLVDSLIVVDAIPLDEPLPRFAAQGTVCPPALGSCATFEGAVLHRLRGWLTPAPAVDVCATARVYGALGGTQPCGDVLRYRLTARRMEPAERRNVLFRYFVHPGVLDANTAGVLRAGVMTGPDGCWHLERAGLERRDDTLHVTGTAILSPFAGGCPLAVVYDTVSVTIPPLPTGRYFIVASGLLDTLEVANPAPRTDGPSFAAYGCVDESDPACVAFTGDYPGSNKEVDGVLTGYTPGIHLPGCGAIVVGTLLGRVTCAAAETNDLRVRGLQWLGQPQVPQVPRRPVPGP